MEACCPVLKVEMKTRYNHIHFVDQDVLSDVKTWECRNNKSGAVLGGVFFYRKWRKYCFVPETGSFFDETCLQDIIHFLGQLK